MANQYQPQQLLTNHALDCLVNELTFLKGCARDNEHLFGNDKKSGQQVMVRLPPRLIGRIGETYSPEAYQETSVPVTIRPLQGMDIDLPSSDWTTNIADVKEEILRPAMAQLVNNVERDCLQLAYRGTANYVGVPGTAPSTSTVILQAGAYIDNEGGPSDGKRRMLISPNTNVSLVPAFQGLLNPQAKIGKQYEKGKLATDTLGFDHFQTQNLWMHTIGTCTGTPVAATVGAQTGTSIQTTGWTPNTLVLKQGDVIQFANVNAVNPMTRDLYGGLRNCVATADVTSDGSGNATIPIQTVSGQGIVPAPAQFATTDAAVQNGAAITVFGVAQAGLAALAATKTTQCLGYHKNAFTFAGIGQKIPKGSTEQAWEATDPKTGIQLRFVQQFLGKENLFINRFDVMYAFAVQQAQLAVRMCSN